MANEEVTAAVTKAKENVLAHLAKDGVGRTFGHLMVACGLEEGRHVEGVPHTRILDRALKSLKNAKKIAYVKREWRLV